MPQLHVYVFMLPAPFGISPSARPGCFGLTMFRKCILEVTPALGGLPRSPGEPQAFQKKLYHPELG